LKLRCIFSLFVGSVETGLKVDEIAGEIPVKKVTPTENGGSEVEKPKRHTGHILCLAVSSDGKYLVSAAIKLNFFFKMSAIISYLVLS